MSHDTSWDIDDHRDEHESDEHWSLRRSFIERWKDNYPMDRLLCLARVFTNIEFMGCRYPPEVMQEIATLSQDVAKTYRSSRGNKLQRTFVSASDAAEDRAKGVKRKAGIVEEPSSKRISFVAAGHKFESEAINIDSDNVVIPEEAKIPPKPISVPPRPTLVPARPILMKNPIVLDDSDVEIVEKEDKKEQERAEKKDYSNEYDEEFRSLQWLDVRSFREQMFLTSFGRLLLIVRPWMSKLNNIQASCSQCGLEVRNEFLNSCMTLYLNGKVAASVTGASKAEARGILETIVWNRMRTECVMLMVKEQFIARDSVRINSDSVAGANNERAALETGFGTPLESSVASKMMKLMGWTGGGLGANEEGISEPIRPHLSQVHRAGLGGGGSEIVSQQQLKYHAGELMRKYRADDTIDVDLVFSADFSKDERADLHQVARRNGLNSKSYGTGEDRFLVVRKKIDPFTIARAVVQKGGSTAKYQVFLPRTLADRR